MCFFLLGSIFKTLTINGVFITRKALKIKTPRFFFLWKKIILFRAYVFVRETCEFLLAG